MARIDTLQSSMNHDRHKPVPKVPTIRPEEVPERNMEYTSESLLRFKEEQLAREEAEKQAAANIGGFFGGFEGGEEVAEVVVEEDSPSQVMRTRCRCCDDVVVSLSVLLMYVGWEWWGAGVGGWFHGSAAWGTCCSHFILWGHVTGYEPHTKTYPSGTTGRDNVGMLFGLVQNDIQTPMSVLAWCNH